MAKVVLKSAQFRKEREKIWKELDQLIERIEKSGPRSLSSAELHRLPVLYRSAVSSLSVARAVSLDRALLDYLEALVHRSYIHVYSVKQSAWHVAVDFIMVRFPAAVYFHGKLFLASLVLLVAGVFTGHAMVESDMDRFYSFISPDMAQGRGPLATDAQLRESIEGSFSVEELAQFAMKLFTHNSSVGILYFCLGWLLAIPIVILLYYTGLGAGALGAVYASRGMGWEFYAWLMGHGVTELGAICVCGAAGFALGGSLIFPGEYTRMTNLALTGKRVAPMIIGAIGMLFIAGLIEGFFRQMVHSQTLRWLMAGSTFLFWLYYFIHIGRRGLQIEKKRG